jgi:hypothetical protein
MGTPRHHQGIGGAEATLHDLVAATREALRAGNPIDVLMVASALLVAGDDACEPGPRPAPPRAQPTARPTARLATLIDELADSDLPETSILLAALAALTPDELERRRLTRRVLRRAHGMPSWLRGLDGAVAGRTVEIAHEPGGPVDVVVGVSLPTGEGFAVVVTIASWYGAVVTNASVTLESVEDVLARLFEVAPMGRTTTVVDIPDTEASARILDAMDDARSLSWDDGEGDLWPTCQPLLEWVVRLLPDGLGGASSDVCDQWARPPLYAVDHWTDPWLNDRPSEADWQAQRIRERREALEAAVGAQALAGLDTVPLPAEEFDWADVPPSAHDRVREILPLIDRMWVLPDDTELRTASLRALASIAGRGGAVALQRGQAVTAAAAICWRVAKANQHLDPHRGGLTARDFLARVGVRGTVSDRASTLFAAAGFSRFFWTPTGDQWALGSPQYLTSSRRQALIAERDALAAQDAAHAR